MTTSATRRAAWYAAACAEISRAVAAGEGALALELQAFVRRSVRRREDQLQAQRLCSVRGCPKKTRSSVCKGHVLARRAA